MRQLKISTKITNHTESVTLEKYLTEVNNYPLLTAEREIYLTQLIPRGNERAVEELTNANLRFVISVAKQYDGTSKLTLSDLINEGNIGLTTAALRFDETRGFKFISYAVWWIRQSILEAMKNTGTTVRFPSHIVDASSKTMQAADKFEQQHEREPTIEELSEIVEVSKATIATVLKKGQTFSLDTPISENNGNHLTHGDMIIEDISPDGELLGESIKIDMKRTLRKCLRGIELDVIVHLFGLNGNDTLNAHRELEVKYDVSRERIRQIKNRALNRVKNSEFSQLIKQYW